MSWTSNIASTYSNSEVRCVQPRNDIPKCDTNNCKQRAHKAPVSSSSKRPSETSAIYSIRLSESLFTVSGYYYLLVYTESRCPVFQMAILSSATCSQFEPVREPEPNIENRFSYVRFRFGFSSGLLETVRVRVQRKRSMNRTEPNRGITRKW